MDIEVRPLTGGLGAEIFGANIADQGQFSTLQQAFSDYAVIVIRDQAITPDEQIAFARRFGEINVNRFFATVPDYPEIAMVLKEPDQKNAIGERWHTDHSYDQAPAMCSMLHAIETPAVGGDTVFASMYTSFEALSDGMKTMLRGMKAWHSSRHVFGAARMGVETRATGRIGNTELATQDSLHPVVIRHPLSGREALYINPEFTIGFDGWAEDESKAVIAFLEQHCTKPEYTCRVRWAPGTITIW
ncbi:MAG TPA: TauD/TfdA family dioxygenase, partial [Hyphomicrobiaceae bacterium]|nr:TauD/TfdA family dioxygenase [Hyphomicrobiaceae bacterium]